MSATTQITANQAASNNIATPEVVVNPHVFTLKVAKEATENYDRVVTELTDFAKQIDAKREEASKLVAPYDKEKLDALVKFYETVQKTVDASQEMITKMYTAYAQCLLATVNLSTARAAQLDTLGMLETTKAAIESAKADAAALPAKTSALQAHINSVNPFTEIVGKPVHAHMYNEGKIFWLTTYAGAIATFRTDQNKQNQTQMVSAPIIAAASTPVVASTQPAQTTPATTTAPAVSATPAAPTATPPVVASAQPAQLSATQVPPQKELSKNAEPIPPKAAIPTVISNQPQSKFDPAQELSVLKNKMSETDRLSRDATEKMAAGKANLIGRQELSDCIGNMTLYLQTHRPEVANKVDAEWNTLWKQAVSAVLALEETLSTLNKSSHMDSKHASKK